MGELLGSTASHQQKYKWNPFSRQTHEESLDTLCPESPAGSQRCYLLCPGSGSPGCCCYTKALEWWTVRLGKTEAWPAQSCERGSGDTLGRLHLWRWREAALMGGWVCLARRDFSSGWARSQQARQHRNLARQTHKVRISHQNITSSCLLYFPKVLAVSQ